MTLTILLGDETDPKRCVELGNTRISQLPAGLSPSDLVEVTFWFQKNGLLHVEGQVNPANGAKPVKVQLDLVVVGQMNEDEIAAARQNLSWFQIE
jgi:hypothetical protein